MKFVDASDPAFIAAAQIGAFKGAVKNLANNVYHGLKSYHSSTALKYLQAKSPAHFKAKYIDPQAEQKEPTSAMILGTLVHCLLLTPAEYQKEFLILPELNLRTNEGKEKKAELLAANPNKVLITDEQLSIAGAMCESARSNPQVKPLLESGHKEASFFWTCPFSGLNFKAKCDSASSKQLIELKTTSDAGPENFARHAYNMNYDLSLIHYRQGIRTIMDVKPPAYFIVIESEAPYVTQVYKASDAMLETGHAKWLEAVTKLANGMQKQEWPGYFSQAEIPELSPPAWAMNKLMKEEMSGI